MIETLHATEGATEGAPVETPEEDSVLAEDTEAEHPNDAIRSAAEIKSAIEAIVFVSDGPLSDKAIAQAVRSTVAEVRPLIDELTNTTLSGVRLVTVAGGYRSLFRASECAEYVRQYIAPKTRSFVARSTRNAERRRVPATGHTPRNRRNRKGRPGLALRMLAERDCSRF
ncbi:MAG: SMC-Scp complex subunit ScpB [Polyangiales bacterium]